MLTIKKKYGRKVSYNNFDHNKSYIAWGTTQKIPRVSVIFLDITCSKGIFLALSYMQWHNIPITTHAAKLVNIRRTHLFPRAQDQQSLETTEAYHKEPLDAYIKSQALVHTSHKDCNSMYGTGTKLSINTIIQK
jgi:hypothetical protein